MDKEILTFGDIEIEKKNKKKTTTNSSAIRLLFFQKI